MMNDFLKLLGKREKELRNSMNHLEDSYKQMSLSYKEATGKELEKPYNIQEAEEIIERKLNYIGKMMARNTPQSPKDKGKEEKDSSRAFSDYIQKNHPEANSLFRGYAPREVYQMFEDLEGKPIEDTPKKSEERKNSSGLEENVSEENLENEIKGLQKEYGARPNYVRKLVSEGFSIDQILTAYEARKIAVDEARVYESVFDNPRRENERKDNEILAERIFNIKTLLSVMNNQLDESTDAESLLRFAFSKEGKSFFPASGRVPTSFEP